MYKYTYEFLVDVMSSEPLHDRDLVSLLEKSPGLLGGGDPEEMLAILKLHVVNCAKLGER